MTLDYCHESYWEFVRTLRNDERVINGFIVNQFITTEQQVIYMKQNSVNFRIALIDKTPVGFIGVINNDIRICTHPNYQGKGVAKFMLRELCKIWPNAIAKVKLNNNASNNLFLACGYKKIDTDSSFNYYKL
jgi:RimJ/RimL family protein N-acetyltransferase